MTSAEGATAAVLLGKFALGYLAVLAVPGPNMLMIGTMASLRGFRGMLPCCLGLAGGAVALAAAMQLAFSTVAELPGLQQVARSLGGVLLLAVALRIMRALPPPEGREVRPSQDGLVAFGAGFCTAASNPITAAYFAAQFIGPLAGSRAAWLALPVVAAEVLLCGLLVALIFAGEAARRLVVAYHRPVCVMSAAALGGLALVMLSPLLVWEGDFAPP